MAFRGLRRVYALALVITALAGTGCDVLAQAVLDGVLDFVESSVANALEETFPIKSAEANSGGGGGG